MTFTLPHGWARRFQLDEVLGEGCLGTTWLARDLGADPRTLAVKVLHERLGSCSVECLRHVTHTLEQMRTVHCASVPALHQWDFTEAFWLVRDYVPVASLRGWKGTTLPQALDALVRVARSLALLHGAGLVHGYLKPSNVLLPPEEGAAVLTDAGLYPLLQSIDPSDQRAVVETYPYMSPEHFGIVAGGVDPRSDLYALGVLGYQTIAGITPFGGASSTEILHMHAAQEPPPVSAFVEVPRFVDEILLRLLRKERSERYASAEMVLRDLEEAHARATSGTIEVASVPRDLRLADSGQLVGRTSHLEALTATARRLRDGHGQVTVVAGGAGSGKTSLLGAVRAIASNSGLLYCFGKCQAFADGRPYQSLEAAASTLVAQWGRLPVPRRDDIRQRLAADLGDLASALVRVLPELTPLLGAADTGEVDPELAPLQVRQGLLTFLRGLAVHWQPVVLVQDDMQWAHPATLALLRHVAERADDCPAWLLFSLRSEDADGARVQSVFASAAHLDCSPLDEDDTRQLLRGLMGELEEEPFLAHLVWRRSGGNPFAIMELLRAMLAENALQRRPFGWLVNRASCEALSLPEQLADLTLRRAHDLDADARRWLGLAGLAGSVFDPYLVALADGQPVERVEQALEEAANRQLVERVGGRFQFLHDRIREAVVRDLEESAQKGFHEALGRALERQPDADPFALAHHFQRSGLAVPALRYTVEAAQAAREIYAYAAVALLCENALALIKKHSLQAAGSRADLLGLLGEAHFAQGSYVEAVTALEERLREELPLDHKVATLELLARAHHDSAHLQQAVHALSTALEAVGEVIPVSRGSLAVANGRTLAGLLLSPHLWPSTPLDATRRRTAVRLYHFSALVWFFLDYDRSLHTHLQSIRLAHGLEDCEEVVLAYGAHSVTVGNLGFQAATRRYGERAVAMAERLGNRRALAGGLYLYGAGLYCGGLWREALDVLERAVGVNREVGDLWKAASSTYLMVWSLLDMGQGHKARATYDRSHQLRADLGSEVFGHHADVIYDSVGARLALLDGRTEDACFLARRALEKGHDSPDRIYRLIGANGFGRVAVALGNLDEAIPILEASVHEIRKNRLVETLVNDAPALLAEAYAARLEATHEARWGKAVLRTCGSAFWWAKMHPFLLPALWRARGRAMAVLDRRKAALAAFDESLKHARRLGMSQEEGLTMWRKGVAERAWAIPTAQETLMRAEHILDETGDRLGGDQVRRALGLPAYANRQTASPMAGVVSTGLAVQIRRRRVLELARQIAATLRIEDLVPLVLRSALEVTGAQRCVLVLRDDLIFGLEGETPPIAPPNERGSYRLCGRMGTLEDVPISRVLLAEVLRKGVPIQVDSMETRADLFPEVPRPPSLRAILVAPIAMGGETTGALYLDTRQVSHLLGDEEGDLFDSIVGQAAVAIQNAVHLVRVRAQHEEILAERERTHARDLSLLAAEERKNALAAFLGIASHDLRGPLTLIRLAAAGLKPTTLPEDLAESRGSIEYACRRALSLIEGYLDVVRAEAGHTLELKREPFQAANLIQDEVEFQLGCLTERRRAALDVRLQTEAGSVSGSPERLRQVIANLVGNALKFTPAGGHIDILSRTEGDRFTFSVADSGPGIAAEALERLFRPFERASATHPGSGLGLWIAKVIIEAHGGQMGVDTEEGKGSRFWFEIPRVEAAAP